MRVAPDLRAARPEPPSRRVLDDRGPPGRARGTRDPLPRVARDGSGRRSDGVRRRSASSAVLATRLNSVSAANRRARDGCARASSRRNSGSSSSTGQVSHSDPWPIAGLSHNVVDKLLSLGQGLWKDRVHGRVELSLVAARCACVDHARAPARSRPTGSSAGSLRRSAVSVTGKLVRDRAPPRTAQP